jgi:hypothetical protein
MLLQPKRSFVGFVCCSICFVAILQACSTAQSMHSNTDAIKNQTISELSNQNQKMFTDKNPTIVSRIGNLELTTRMATPVEIPGDKSKERLWVSAEGAGALTLGLVAAPMFASGLVVGGIMLVPLGTYGYLHEKGIWDSINGALSTAEFTRAIDSAMKNRLRAAFTEDNMPNVKIEITIQVLGIVKATGQDCLVALAHFGLNNDTEELKEDNLHITVSGKSEDAPPPQCTTLDRFAENEARLVKNTLAEYAEVLAVMAIDRIPKGSTK